MAKLFSPLGGDTVSPLNAPAVHMGLLTKLNLLAIGLIVATALGIAAFLIGQQIRDEESGLTTQGFAMAAMLAEVADEAISSSDMSNVASVLDGLVSDRDIAYVAVLDAEQRPAAGGEMAAARQPHRRTAGGAVERLGHRGAPVDDHRLLPLVGDGETADVPGVAVPVAVATHPEIASTNTSSSSATRKGTPVTLL